MASIPVETEFSHWRISNAHSPDHDFPVLAEVDVVVVGAGPAGVAAATVAAESGLSVLIVEGYGFAGGSAVAGLSATICGLYLASETEREPEQVVHGFTERFRAALAARGGVTPPQRYGLTYTVAHDPLVWREVADALLFNAGVRVMYHTQLTGVVMDADKYTGIIVHSKAGMSAIHARRVIDASGDAAAVARGGGKYFFGDEGRIQNPTMFFRLGGIDTDAFWAQWGADTISPPAITKAIVSRREKGADLPREKIWVFRSTRPGELLVNATRLSDSDGRMLNVIDPEDFTIAEMLGRKQVRAYAEFFASEVDGCRNAYVVDTGVEAGIRQTRSIVGVETLSNDHVLECRKSEHGIVRSPWPIELHSGNRPKLHWLLDDYYEIPYNTLVPAVGENIIVAGRCLSAEHEALASARVTAQCFELGHAAAVATILSLESERGYRDIAGSQVRAIMAANGSSL
ncbi:MAG: FAD-dependent oxidoreductase [Rhodoglobus sp.]